MKKKARHLLTEQSAKIRQARESAGLTQAQVAEQLELTSEGYGFYERGTRTIGMESFLLLPKILGCKITDLLPDSLVTSEDEVRARDFRLQEIVAAWPRLTAAQRRVLLTSLDAFLPEE